MVRTTIEHAHSEISRPWELLIKVNVPSAQSVLSRNKHKEHVVPRDTE